MTSNPLATFVFVQLPSTAEIVVAGRFELSIGPAGPVGRFRYGQSYLARPDAFALDPIHLPLIAREFQTALNGGLFGVLRDAAPDFWGRTVIERRGIPDNELAYLLASSDLRVGALSFGPTPDPPPLRLDEAVPLHRIGQATTHAAAHEAALAGDDSIRTNVAELLEPSSGLGGARPKTVVVDDDGQFWIAKFPSRHDRWDNAIAEAAYARLAGECGIRVAETRILRVDNRRILLVRRFDQSPQRAGPVIRRPFLSAHTLLGLGDDVVDRRMWSYLELAHILRRISTHPQMDARELFQRAVFNALTTNIDDHPRNHAILWEGGGWCLSPAYDLTPSPAQSLDERRLAMDIGEIPGRNPRWANRANLLSGASHFGLSRDEANDIIAQIKVTVMERWRPIVAELGGSERFQDQIAHAFPEAYPGFEFDAV